MAASPVRIGKLRNNDGGARGWRAKLYAPTSSYAYHRVKFKDPATMQWVDRPVPGDEDPDEHFDKIERALDRKVAQPSRRSGTKPSMSDLAGRYFEWLRAGNKDATYIINRRCLLRVWVLKTDGDLLVETWGPEHSQRWIAAARTKGLSPGRVEDLGVALSGMRKTAWRKGPDGTRWLDPSENPMEDVDYSRRGTEEGAHRDYVPPSARPTTAQVQSVIAAAVENAPWDWMPWQLRVGAFCGPRLGEQLAIRAVDVDLVGMRLRIRNSICWPRPSSGIEWGLKATKTKRRREVPYPASLHAPLISLCCAALGLPIDATVEAITAAQETLYEHELRALDERVLRTNVPRPVSPNEGFLFTDEHDVLPPTKERYGAAWRKLRAASAWPSGIPWRNARHHAATWWRSVIVNPKTGAPVAWEVVAGWLGHSVTTCLNHYVRAGEDADVEARQFLDRL